MKLAGLRLRILADDDVGFKKNQDSAAAKAYSSSGKTQDEIAKAAGVDPSTISRYKSKTKGIARNPSFSTLKKMPHATGVPITKIFPELK